MNPLVSVVIPFYSNFEWLSEAVESVTSQSFNDFEIIVVNDGSPEDDSLFLAKYGKVIRYYKDVNKGPAAARNLGIEKARGEYVAFLDSDDIWEPDKLKIQIAYMRNTGSIWSHTGYSTFDNSTGCVIKEVQVDNFHSDVFYPCLVSSPIATPCVVIRRDFLLENPGIRFPVAMRYGQDSMMWLQIAEKIPLGVVPYSLCRVRIRGTNAGGRARVYLYIKSRIWRFFLNSEVRSISLPVPHYLQWVYRWCYFFDKILYQVEKRFNVSSNVSEIVSRMFYLPAHVLLKMFKKNCLRSYY